MNNNKNQRFNSRKDSKNQRPQKYYQNVQQDKPVEKNKTKNDFVAKTINGFEEILADELRQIGAKNLNVQKRAVGFDGDKELLYSANLNLRTALRVLKPIHYFSASNEDRLYQEIKKIDWSKYFDVDDTFAIDATVNSKYFTHSKYAALKTKDAIVDQFRDKHGKRPSVDLDTPTVKFNLHINDDECTVLLDSSGDSLHKRGYRLDQAEAPLNEVLAAGLILLSGWDKTSDFVDPMCGSGTLPIEAGLIAGNIAPGMTRKNFGFMTWKDFDENLWSRVISKAERNEIDVAAKIFGSDLNNKNLEFAIANAKRAGLSEFISFKHCAIENLKPFEDGGVSIINPPYGERLELKNPDEFYKMVGDSLKQNFADFDVWIISSNKEAMKRIGLRTSKKLTLYNGSLESKFHKYEMYRGSKKDRD